MVSRTLLLGAGGQLHSRKKRRTCSLPSFALLTMDNGQIFHLLNSEEIAPGCTAVQADSTFSEPFPGGVKKCLKYKYDRNLELCARLLSGKSAILRVNDRRLIDDGD